MYKQKGFTLLEVLITAAIIAILALISIPVYQNYIISARAREVGQIMLKDSQYMEKYYMACGSYAKDTNSNANPPCAQGNLNSSRIVWPTPLPYSVSPESGSTLYTINFNTTKPPSCSSSLNCVSRYILRAIPICGTIAAQSNSCACVNLNAPTTIIGGNKSCYVCVDQDSNLICNADANCTNTSGSPC